MQPVGSHAVNFVVECVESSWIKLFCQVRGKAFAKNPEVFLRGWRYHLKTFGVSFNKRFVKNAAETCNEFLLLNRIQRAVRQ